MKKGLEVTNIILGIFAAIITILVFFGFQNIKSFFGPSNESSDRVNNSIMGTWSDDKTKWVFSPGRKLYLNGIQTDFYIDDKELYFYNGSNKVIFTYTIENNDLFLYQNGNVEFKLTRVSNSTIP